MSYTRIEPIRNASKQKKEEKEIDIENDKSYRHIDTFIYPHSVHGVVIVKESETGTAIWGSGTLIASRIVLTAAHNIYDEQKPIQKRYPFLKFIPGAMEVRRLSVRLKLRISLHPRNIFITYQERKKKMT